MRKPNASILREQRLRAHFEKLVKPWRDAIDTLRTQLGKTCLIHDAARRRFQRGQLIENLVEQFEKIAATEQSRHKDVTLVVAGYQAYWLFCGSVWQDNLGYNEARKQHFAELEALGFPRELEQPKRGNDLSWIDELFFRLDSLASWIEAEDSFIMWRDLGTNHAKWDDRDRGAQTAALVAKLPTFTDVLSDFGIARLVESFKQFSPQEWRSVLRRSAALVENEQQPGSFANWLWWRFPIFRRYKWSAREAYDAANARFGNLSTMKSEGAFKSYCVRLGLRFSGGKKRKRRPLLSCFVAQVPVPQPQSIPDGLVVLYWPRRKPRR